MKEIIVRVMRPQRRDVYVAYWTDPVTGKRRQKSTGQTANVVVAKHKSKTKYASAHDLRRSFGERWSDRVMPKVLMVMMRHASIETTMKYYTSRDASTVAESVWEAVAK